MSDILSAEEVAERRWRGTEALADSHETLRARLTEVEADSLEQAKIVGRLGAEVDHLTARVKQAERHPDAVEFAMLRLFREQWYADDLPAMQQLATWIDPDPDAALPVLSDLVDAAIDRAERAEARLGEAVELLRATESSHRPIKHPSEDWWACSCGLNSWSWRDSVDAHVDAATSRVRAFLSAQEGQ